ncbi:MULTISPECIES: sensor histidine kinase [Corynebacterium]|uniref:sensor histidine kinase n=1 Tax=Corynebacterium TaxID=1716 RepID=UPI001FEF9EC7|nr:MULTISPECIES: ATP-binding protein [Corynebacterium]
MVSQRLPTTVILASLALIFSGASILNESPRTPLITVLIMTQALSLIVAPRYPRISTGIYITAFLGALLAGHSTGVELFLGVFLITAITATNHHLLTLLVAVTITLGGFYSPHEAHFTFEAITLMIFCTIATLAYLLGLWIHRNHQQHLNTQRIQQARRQQLTSLLHDTIAADLTSVIAQAEKLAVTTPQRQDELKGVAGTARNALDRTRQLLTTLNTHPNTEPTNSLPIILDTTTKRLRDHGFTVTTTTRLATPVTMTLPNTALERVLSETATNIIKHATPHSTVAIDTTSDDEGVTITVTNHHTPAQAKPTGSTHLGLTSMSQTLHTLGGTLIIRSDEQEWITIARLPFLRR